MAERGRGTRQKKGGGVSHCPKKGKKEKKKKRQTTISKCTCMVIEQVNLLSLCDTRDINVQ